MKVIMYVNRDEVQRLKTTGMGKGCTCRRNANQFEIQVDVDNIDFETNSNLSDNTYNIDLNNTQVE